VRFADGMSLTLDASWACHTDAGDRTGVQLFGTEAGAGSMPPRLFRQQTDGYAVVDLPKLDTTFPHNDRFHNVINHLLEREALCVTPEQALAVQAVLDGVYASCASGREVRIDTTI
jgi:predicted dehydrogenase